MDLSQLTLAKFFIGFEQPGHLLFLQQNFY